jgi:hypothetical protein
MRVLSEDARILCQRRIPSRLGRNNLGGKGQREVPQIRSGGTVK